MKCFEIQNEIPEYLEDMLAEEARAKIHAHLSDCLTCRSHAARLGSLSGDLKELARVPVPFNLEQAVLEGLSEESSILSRSFNGRKLAVYFFAALCLAGILKIGYESKRRFENTQDAENKKSENAQAAAIFEKLKQTEASLQRSTGEAGAKAARRRTVASLEPFHWHLKFPSVSERQVFAEKIKRINTRPEFGTDYLLAFSMEQTLLGNLLSAINDSLVVVADGPHADFEKLPQSEAPLRITLLMEVDGAQTALFWWQLRFLRQNSYLLAQRLRAGGFEFLYEAPHFLLLRVSSLQYIKLRSEIQEMLGLQIIRGNGREALLENAGESFPVILFLQAG